MPRIPPFVARVSALALLLSWVAPAAHAGPPGDRFTAEGLVNETLLTHLFEGRFVDIDLDSSDDRFFILFRQYLESYARSCAEFLPRDRVELTRERCSVEEVTTNGFGAEVGRTCVSYKTVGTGLFAKPALYGAYKTAERWKSADALRGLSRAFEELARPDVLSHLVTVIGDATSIAADMSALVQTNACGGPGLGRFEDNLRLFALNKQPIPLTPGPASSAIEPAESQASRDHDYGRFIEDLILADTQRWGMFARFVEGSVSNASVTGRDPSGRPVRVAAGYRWEGLLGPTSGRVTVTFSDGQPECLTYSETPAVCHGPDRRVAARYAQGGYAR